MRPNLLSLLVSIDMFSYRRSSASGARQSCYQLVVIGFDTQWAIALVRCAQFPTAARNVLRTHRAARYPHARKVDRPLTKTRGPSAVRSDRPTASRPGAAL